MISVNYVPGGGGGGGYFCIGSDGLGLNRRNAWLFARRDHFLSVIILSGYPSSPQAILGAFLHDVGHLVAQDRGLERMATGDVILGAQHHDTVGETFLRELGVPQSVTQYCRGHVDAKRYLTYKDAVYYNSTYLWQCQVAKSSERCRLDIDPTQKGWIDI